MSAHPTRSIFHIRSWYGGFSSRSSSGSRRRPRPSCGMNRHRWGIRTSHRISGETSSEEPGKCRVCRIADQAAGSRRASLDFDAGRRARFDCFDRPIRFRGAGRRAAPPSFTDEDAAGTARTAKSPRSMNPITRRITRPPRLLACGPSRSFDPLRSPHPASRSYLLNGGGGPAGRQPHGPAPCIDPGRHRFGSSAQTHARLGSPPEPPGRQGERTAATSAEVICCRNSCPADRKSIAPAPRPNPRNSSTSCSTTASAHPAAISSHLMRGLCRGLRETECATSTGGISVPPSMPERRRDGGGLVERRSDRLPWTPQLRPGSTDASGRTAYPRGQTPPHRDNRV